ncbi:hypothetical protein [Couchioplanes azureus]|uniref:hypothetical protein n=1 Tax=Couchioplanes caeruleus TaxID=56438 RepID=UPI00167051F3|nr:hypothetical protein [Couchioplanes caeruleus]GGQ46373.1 hypothetical protein GCM10010166_13760 [Couchioplanes caeruleus subsp. azureus]
MLIALVVAVVVLSAALLMVVRRRSSAPSQVRGGAGPDSRTAGFGHYDGGTNGTY